MSEEKRIYGIDLGTAYSAIAFVNEFNQAEIIPNSDNERVTPSVVFFESPTNIIVGRVAKEAAKTDPGAVVDFIKRQIGTDYAFHYGDVDYKPEEISSYILRRLVEDAKQTTGRDVKDVVITCPAYFGEAERNATRLAGELAGLNVLQILDEPAAAALYYGMNGRDANQDSCVYNFGDGLELDDAEGCKSRNAVVYDLGGGTFDVTVVAIDDAEIRIVCSDGDHRLGGKDWDDAIVRYLVSEFENATGLENILDDPETSCDLRYDAEKAKRTLTKRDATKVRVSSCEERLNVEITRERFEELTRDLVDRTIEFTRSVLETAKTKGVEKIDEFLLVGGSTRMPMIAERVREAFADSLGCEPQMLEVDEAVAKGAALFGQCRHIKIALEEKAQELVGKSFDELNESERQSVVDETSVEQGVSSDYVLETVKRSITTVATKSYGVRAKKNGVPVVRNLIARQTPTPTIGSSVFFTEDADAEYVELRVFSNNSSEDDAPLEESFELGTATLELPPGLPARSKVRVEFELSPEGRLEMTAVEETTNVRIVATFQADVGMSEEEFAAARERGRELTIE